MKKLLLLLAIAIVSCSGPARNFAASYVDAVDPDAICLRWGDNAVLCREKSVLFYCEASATKHTTCQQLADLNPKRPPPPSSQEPIKPEPPKIDPPKEIDPANPEPPKAPKR